MGGAANFGGFGPCKGCGSWGVCKCPPLAGGVFLVPFEVAAAETERLQNELDITNADHVALWLEANLPDASLAWLACRIVEAHEAHQGAGEP
ncbi:hypothetical protein [Sphingopyxis sp. 22461]|uniref:hypothetical protein n=1 Tax=Sphingopyxis sp. 22461 TaxID=3453923 RepID=UPI003F87CC14